MLKRTAAQRHAASAAQCPGAHTHPTLPPARLPTRRSFSPENKRCGGGPCCFLRGSSGFTVIYKPGGRVSGVFYTDSFPSVGTTV